MSPYHYSHTPEQTVQEQSHIIYRSIKDWNPEERPRERLEKHGAEYLSDSELLAILLKTGARSFSAVEAGRELLHRFGSLTELAERQYMELADVRGVGKVKAITLHAAFEIGRRVESKPFISDKSIRSPEDVARFFIPRLRGQKVESFYAVLLNTANQIIRYDEISRGSLGASIVHPREVFKRAIIESAAAMIVLHNHPSGNPEPSREDISITKQLKEAGTIIGIKVLDHLIIAGDTYTSLQDRGQF